MRHWCVAMLMVIMITMLMHLDATAQAGCDTSLPTLYQQVSPSVVARRRSGLRSCDRGLRDARRRHRAH